jgi:hypothetical protein
MNAASNRFALEVLNAIALFNKKIIEGTWQRMPHPL